MVFVREEWEALTEHNKQDAKKGWIIDIWQHIGGKITNGETRKSFYRKHIYGECAIDIYII